MFLSIQKRVYHVLLTSRPKVSPITVYWPWKPPGHWGSGRLMFLIIIIIIIIIIINIIIVIIIIGISSI